MAKTYDAFGRGVGGEVCCRESRLTGREAAEALIGRRWKHGRRPATARRLGDRVQWKVEERAWS